MATDDTTNLPPLPTPKYGSLNYQRGGLPSSAKENKQKENKQKEPVVASPPTKSQQPAKTQTTTQTKKPLLIDNQKVQYQPATGFSRFGRDMQTGDYVDVPQASRRQGLYIIGANGTGKTGLIEHLILQDINQGLGVGLLDPHGDLTNAILAKMTKRVEDVILLDIQDEDYPFGLNIFECQNPQSNTAVQKIVDLVMHIFEKLYDVSRQTPRMAQYLRNCTYTLVANPGYTMADIPLLLTDEDCRRHLIANVTDSKVRLFWKTYDAMKPAEQREHAESTLNKLDEFLSPLVINIVGQAKTTVNIQQIMDERKILLVKLSAQLDQVTSLIGSAIIAMVLNAAYSRASIPIHKRKQFNLYADEFQRFATEDFATLLTEARKFGIATTIAHQARYQPGMTDGIRAVSLQAANYVMFRITSPDADELAGSFNIKPEEAWEEELEEESIEVLAEEWFERVEEEVIDGEEEIQTPVSKPVDWLLSGKTHQNNAVNALLQKWDIDRLEEYIRLGVDSSRHRKMIDEINTLLYTMMIEKTPSVIPLPVTFLQWITLGFRHYFDFIGDSIYINLTEVQKHPFYQTYMRLLLAADIEQSLRVEGKILEDHVRQQHTGDIDHINDLLEKVYKTPVGIVFSQQPAVQWEISVKDRLQYLKHAYGLQLHTNNAHKLRWIRGQGEYKERHYRYDGYGLGSYETSTLGEGWVLAPGQESYLYSQQDILNAVENAVNKEIQSFEAFIRHLHEVMHILAAEPILEGSGIRQPRKRKQINYHTHPPRTIAHPRVAITHPQRTYQDVKNDIANQLSSMPDFTARTRITIEGQTVEHTIKTLEPEKGLFGKPLQERIANIQSQNRGPQYGGYCRPRKDVETEITSRQTSYSVAAPIQPQKPQQQLPRHARQVPVPGHCPNCGVSNILGARFCNQCGAKLR